MKLTFSIPISDTQPSRRNPISFKQFSNKLVLLIIVNCHQTATLKLRKKNFKYPYNKVKGSLSVCVCTEGSR